MNDSVMNRDDIKKYLGFMFCYILMLGVFCYTKQGNIEGFGKAILPMTFIMLFLFVLAVVLQSCDMRYVMMTIVLIGLGTVMQVLVGDRKPYSYMSGRMESLGLAIILVFLCILSQHIPIKVRIGLYAFVIVVLLLLSIKFGITLNGSRAWIGIKDPATDKILWSIQATEILKIISLLVLSAIFGSTKLSDREKIHYTFIVVLMITSLIGVYMKEFGTVLVLFLVWILAVYMVLGERFFMKASLCICGLSVAIISISHICNKVSKIIVDKRSLLIKPIVKTATIWGKLSQRLDLFFHMDKMESYQAPYQLILSRKALRLAGLFGNSNSFYDIPVQSSDMVMSMILLRMGLILGFIIVIVFLLSYRESFNIARTNTHTVEKYTVILFASFIIIQTLLSMFSSQGFFLLIGLPVCLFSSGNTQDMITMSMILYIIYASRKSVQDAQAYSGEVPSDVIE